MQPPVLCGNRPVMMLVRDGLHKIGVKIEISGAGSEVEVSLAALARGTECRLP